MKYALGLAFLLLVPVVAGTAAAGVATAPRDAPAAPLFVWVPAGGFEDDFPFGQCTWWVAYNRRVTWGGNAADWLVNAKAQGVMTASGPAVGSIVVYRPGGEYSSLGHVAVVIALSPTTYTVSEMNAAAGWGRVNTRVIAWPDPQVEGFIRLTEDEARPARTTISGPK